MSIKQCRLGIVSIALAVALVPHICLAQYGNYDALIDRWSQTFQAGEYQEAERVARQILAINERQFPEKYGHVFLGLALREQGKYGEAEKVFKSGLAHLKHYSGVDNIVYAETLDALATTYTFQGRLDEAEPLHEQSIQIYTRTAGPNATSTLYGQINLALLYAQQGDLKRAADLYWKIAGPLAKNSDVEPGNLVVPWLNLGAIYNQLGRYEKTEEVCRYGIALGRARNLDAEHPRIVFLVHNLAVSYVEQSRFDEAAALFEWAIPAAEKTLGADSLNVGRLHADYSICLHGLERRDAAVEHQRLATTITENVLGLEHHQVAIDHFNLGVNLTWDGRMQEAEQACRKALAITEKSLGTHHRQAADIKVILAEICTELDRYDEAQRLLTESLADLQAAGTSEKRRHHNYRAQAQLNWKQGKKAEAVAALAQALELAEATRVHAGGAELERAASFAEYSRTFELMLHWQLELGDVQEAFRTIERSRARTFLEALSMPGAVLLSHRTPQERQALQQHEFELRGRTAKLENDLDRLHEATGADDQATRARTTELLQTLAEARELLYQHYRDLRSSSPVYRELISVKADLPALADVQTRLVGNDGVLLSYFIGSNDSYALVVRFDNARLVALTVDDQQAAVLGIEPGSLTRHSLQQVLMRTDGAGVLQRISRPDPIDDTLSKLAVLWKVLIPEDIRTEIVTGKVRRMTVLPDGPLALLPLETLVVEQESLTQYLLDMDVAMNYGPSAAVLLNLADRPSLPLTDGHEPLLTVGDPAYTAQTSAPPPQTDLLGQASRTTRASEFRSRLSRLPYSGLESHWVAQVFRKAELPAVQLLAGDATERNVRDRISARRYVHLACHGMSSNNYGNFFGALAFARGAKAGDPADDGMLTLAEIYDLDLKGCELALLSACVTNYGPQQQGEGVWALSRGFLVAGSRRVIASNWVVDDQAGASLISVACSRIAQSEQGGRPIDCATALQNAKRWIREQEKWQSPFYWGAFVLVGP